MDKPLVQIPMCTYNHEKYIGDAIKGVLMQNTNFKFELLIGEDASTDNTAQVIDDYSQNYPDIIKPVYRKKNLGAVKNTIDLFNRITADYVALCDGDDYWTDPNKLQKQVDFLEQHKEVAFIGGRSTVNGEKRNNEFGSFGISEFISNNIRINTSTFFFRRENILFELINIMDDKCCGELVIMSIASKYGEIYRMEDYLSNYRVHAGGVNSVHKYLDGEEYTQKRVKLIKSRIYKVVCANRITNYEHAEIALDRIDFRIRQINDLLKNGRFSAKLEILLNILRIDFRTFIGLMKNK